MKKDSNPGQGLYVITEGTVTVDYVRPSLFRPTKRDAHARRVLPGRYINYTSVRLTSYL